MILFESGKRHFTTKNKMEKKNRLFYQFFKKSVKRVQYLDCGENLNFEIFKQFLSQIQIYHFFAGV